MGLRLRPALRGTRSAKLNTAFLDVAVAGDMGLPWTLPRLVGAGKARELSLLPRKVTADEAAAIGLVNAAFDDDTFRDEVQAIVDVLAAKAPLARRGMKAHYVDAESMGFGEFIAMETKDHGTITASRTARKRSARSSRSARRSSRGGDRPCSNPPDRPRRPPRPRRRAGVHRRPRRWRSPSTTRRSRSIGLHNTLMPIGTQLLEIVAPITEGTTAERFLLRRKGAGGYMVITQTDDHPPRRSRVDELGIRIVGQFDEDGFTNMQLHPADTGGSFLEIDEQAGGEDPMGPWSPAGPDWQQAIRTDLVSAITAAEMQCDDPDEGRPRAGRRSSRSTGPTSTACRPSRSTTPRCASCRSPTGAPRVSPASISPAPTRTR